MISNLGERQPMCTCIQGFDSLASHLELTILFRKLEISEHAQSSIVDYFNFFSAEFKFTRSAFSAGYGYKASKTSSLSKFLDSFQNNNS